MFSGALTVADPWPIASKRKPPGPWLLPRRRLSAGIWKRGTLADATAVSRGVTSGVRSRDGN